VPHPLLHEREFALEPLCEIMADYRHPQLGRSLKDIYFELKEKR
jgi:2-amino-4-hydroxy-6-hydroxymethyldihydropteridine diphosphokinase